MPLCVAHSGDKVVKINQHSEQMLDKLEKEYPDVFSKPHILYKSIDNHSKYL